MRHHFHSHCHAPNDGRGEGFSRRSHFFRRDGEREGSRPRIFEQGDLRWVILALIAEKPAHGYEIIKAIEDRLGGSYAPSPGTVYPTLTLLEELGYIRVKETEGPRKLYEITAEGETALEQNRGIVDAILAKMAEIQSPPQRTAGAAARARLAECQNGDKFARRARPVERGADRKDRANSRRRGKIHREHLSETEKRRLSSKRRLRKILSRRSVRQAHLHEIVAEGRRMAHAAIGR